jgi:AraC-like DNA-binding protein
VLPDAEHVMEYHVVTQGSCWGAIVGEAPVRLEAGDVVLFPQGDPHVISSAPGMRAPVDLPFYFGQATEALPVGVQLYGARTVREGVIDHRADTSLVCGFLGCDARPFNPLIATLPRLVHVRYSKTEDWTAALMRQAVAETRERRPGGGAMLERMSEMIFVEAVRRYIDALPEGSLGWLAGVRDRFVGRVLALMHDAPAADWTVDELARRVGLSRSALHERFLGMIGHPPMQYLMNWRMQLAAGLLRDSSAPIASVAQDVGYDSEASFSRAFKRLVGVPPAAWRRQQAKRS